MTNLEKRIDLVQERCCLDKFGRFCLEFLLLYEWDAKLQQEEGLYADELLEAWDKKNGIEKDAVKCHEREETADILKLLADVYVDETGRKRFRVKKQILQFLDRGYTEENTSFYTEIFTDLTTEDEPDIERKVYDWMLLFADRKRKTEKDMILMNLSGEEGSGRLENVKAFCRDRKQTLVYFCSHELAKTEQPERSEILLRLGLSALLENRVIVMRIERDEEEAYGLLREIYRIWRKLPLLFVILTRKPMRAEASGNAPVPAVFEIREPAEFARREMGIRFAEKWKIPFDDGFGELWQQYLFTPGQFHAIIEQAKDMALARGGQHPSRDELREVCRRQTEYRFEGKAHRVRAKFGWEDLVLSEASKQLLRDICTRMKNRELVYGAWDFSSRFSYGMGTSILFTGSPGTGKTMAAQVMAKELELELFRINLSAVVSKYVGETEKNLNLIFDEASKSLCILFFDEADVLFGKRTEVKDSQDKYQNMEAAFLLQKIEEYEGISILATNYQQNIDEAFKRRLQYVVEFTTPDAKLRAEMWMRAFPKKCPLENNIDWTFLAEQFELTGSNIKNIAVNAAFFAASEAKTVGMHYIVKALRNEYQKSGKRLGSSELGQYEDLRF